MEKPTCTIVENGELCGKSVLARGMCGKHYRRWQRTGDAHKVRQHPGYAPDATCLVDDCPERPSSFGYCGRHYMRWKRHGDPLETDHAAPYAADETCLVDDCDRRPRAEGYCLRHRSNLLTYGNPVPRKERSLGERLAEIGWDVTDRGCWEWRGTRNEDGYGLFSAKLLGFVNARAHRVMYEYLAEPIPDGLILRHSCDNPPCCNPDHQIPGTMAQNSQDMVERGRSHKRGDVCANGHDVTLPGATRDQVRSWGIESVCVECDRARNRRYVRRKREGKKAA
jgi:hypothetical protein